MDTRNQLVDFLKRELIGPDPIMPHIQKNGEEILLLHTPPKSRYGAGILFPQEFLHDQAEAVNDIESEELPDLGDIDGYENDNYSTTTPIEDSLDDEAHDEVINLANSYMPSAMGISCYVESSVEALKVKVCAGRYNSQQYKYADYKGDMVEKLAFFREVLDTEFCFPRADLPLKGKTLEKPILKEDRETGLLLSIVCRTSRNRDSMSNLYTFSVINTNKQGSAEHNALCFFQVGLEIELDEAGFLPYPASKSVTNHEDDNSRRLLYKDIKTYAVGHGCAAEWEMTDSGSPHWVKTSIIPTYELKPISPTSFDDVDMSMFEMSDLGTTEKMLSTLSKLCDKYEEWINKQVDLSRSSLSEDHKITADRHISNCFRCLQRMRNGLALLKTDSDVRLAFQLMNRAMLMQQLRYSLPLRKCEFKSGSKVFESVDLPDISDKNTWHENQRELGSWRPFQIAFVLMNLVSMADPKNGEREIVDVIWFPTGGGKTEAYLGLTAYTIFLRRLRNFDDSGTAVLMRYTLRLLTTQQFQRAASLICACEFLRREVKVNLGENPITIGLWVGDNLTPNTRKKAQTNLKELMEDVNANNKFIVLKCPWCAAQMGPAKDKERIYPLGYSSVKSPAATVGFKCDNKKGCDFSKRTSPLPLLVIDEDIYANPPSLLIGTVDKFASLVWKKETSSLFRSKAPPELIIQDELHLISGPLGSVVGHFETLISALCTVEQVKPKIIASTATISRAKEQAHALYNCGEQNVFQFPPQCLTAGDSFFAKEDGDASGRLYVGVHASGLPSHVTAQVRSFSALLQGVKSAVVSNESERDPYWTLLSYFNSLRELGHAQTLIQADIQEYLRVMALRKNLKKTDDGEQRRFIGNNIELTSRISSGDVSDYIQKLEVKYDGERKSNPVDICLATNMVSVGVDIGRLGLMTIIGQPKTTSEYIQATSRVGRSKKGPGLVITLYNPSKPRDRSHYEHFITYHSSLYSQVEPTSVTPFSAPVRERTLHALLIGLIRHLGSSDNAEKPSAHISPDLIQKIKAIIEDRVSKIDPHEKDNTLILLESRLKHWKNCSPSNYGSMFSKREGETPLMYPAGEVAKKIWMGRAWPTPTSMRSVDVSCKIELAKEYKVGENE